MNINKTNLLTLLLSVVCLFFTSSVYADDLEKHTLAVVSKPTMAGSFNTNSASLSTGETIHLYAYANKNFSFKEWTDADGIKISSAQDFIYTMPPKDVTLTAVYEYNPANPANPAKNYWNSLTGEVIIDDFTAGSLSGAVSTALNGGKSSDVLMITVAGRITSNDFNITNNYSNCSLLDLCRVTGVTEVPSYAFDYTKLKSVYLPASIEKIGYHAFYQCQQLSSVTVYAMTPPTLESNVFTGVQEGLVIYVPAAAITQYQDATGWKDFTILPIQEDIRSLSISLPNGTDVTDYSQMWLELTNTKSGQKMHYVMTDRSSYTFANIIRNTSWNAVLRNQRGDIFGKIDNIEVKDEDVSVVFSSLSKPQNISLTVKTPDGDNVTANTQVTWIDSDGNYLAQSTGLNGLLSGYAVKYKVVLSQDLAMQYVAPEQKNHVVNDANNNLTLMLEPIKQITISGCVKDMSTRIALNGATVTASQTFGGKYSKTISTKTDTKGNYSLVVSNVPTSLAVSASDYISKTIVCDSLMTGSESVSLADVSLKTISGAVISLNLTYTKCLTEEGDEDTLQKWYADYNNVSYSIYNKTKQKSVNQFNVQYPQIVLLEEVDEGDVLEMTATSKVNAFTPVKTTATIDAEQRANATFNIVELGKIKSVFAKNRNASVVGSLYDSNGKLVKSYDYSNASLTINNLTDGSYTLVTMGSSKLFNSIYDLSQLPQTGLVLGSDYTQTTIDVQSGKVCAIDIAEVPTLNESKLYYTGDNTSFTVNKSSIVAGNYLTLTGHLDFKSAYAAKVSNVNLIIDLPESCEFVENSVMVGNSTSSYTIQNNRITIPMARYTDRVRFCIIPTLGGDYAPSALAQFDIDGETITQPIGSANYTAKDLSISVPSTVAKTTIPVSGTAIGACDIEIYDGDVMIGQTRSFANGIWSADCKIENPYNLSIHNIHAKVTTNNGLTLWTDNRTITYDKDAIEISVIHMYHFNPEMHKTYDVVFDYQSPSAKAQKYTYYIYNKEFSFTIDFTNNDTLKVKDVVLYVQTGNGTWTALDTKFDKTRKCWFAVGNFGNMYDGNIPKNVGVGYRIVSDASLDTRYIKAYQEDSNEEGIKLVENFKNIDSLYNNLERLDSQSVTYDGEFNSLINSILETSDWHNLIHSVDVALDEESIQKRIREISDSLEINEEFFTKLQNSFGLENISEFEFDGGVLTYDKCDGLLLEDLSEYRKYTTIEGHEVYVFSSEETFDYIDFYNNQRITLSLTPELKAKIILKVSDEGGIKDIKAWISQLYDIGLQIGQKAKPIEKVIEKAAKEVTDISSRLSELEKYANLYKSKGLTASYESVQKEIAKVSKNLAKANTYLKILKSLQRALPILNAVQFINQMQADLNDLINLYYSVPDPCPNDQEEADKIRGNIIAYGVGAGAYGVGQASLIAISIGALIPSVVAATETMGTSLLAEAALIAAQVLSAWAYERTMLHKKEEFEDRISSLKCKKKNNPDPIPNPHPGGGTDPSIDPSGFVYEGVFSNRLEGVTATCYYKEEVEDMYGDLHENIVKWDAEEYAQENPLFTDENGYYRWDVPQGMWQVKFEKEGYETTYSEWLPVPPPQLDVNIAMKQNVQPNIKNARAYEDAVEVEFDKYMMSEPLNTDNIIVMDEGKQVKGTVELLNEEVKYEGESETFASKIRFNANAPFEGTEVTLMVNSRVKSYAGIRMHDNYSQSFTIEQEIRKIVCEPETKIRYRSDGFIPVFVLPASASAGKTINVRSSSQMILGVDATSVVLDENGKAEIPVSGELPGTAALTFTIDGYDLSATTIVNVEQTNNVEIEAPKANIASGTTVEKGTAITLSCATEGATIYYTLDGSCPCDEATRLTYTEPIIINGTVTIKAMAVATDMTESDIVEFTYIADNCDGIDEVTLDAELKIYPLPVRDKLNVTAGGKIIKSVTLTSMSGSTVVNASKPVTMVTLDVCSLALGIYIINVATEDKTYSRKIMKVE